MRITLIVLLNVLLFSLPVMGADGMVDVESDSSVKDTADRLESILKDKGMIIFNRINHSAAASNVGISMADTELMIFGNPKVGSPLMKCKQSVAIDLPQKVLIWIDDHGRVWISYNDPRYLERRHVISGCEQVISKIEKALSDIIIAAASK